VRATTKLDSDAHATVDAPPVSRSATTQSALAIAKFVASLATATAIATFAKNILIPATNTVPATAIAMNAWMVFVEHATTESASAVNCRKD